MITVSFGYFINFEHSIIGEYVIGQLSKKQIIGLLTKFFSITKQHWKIPSSKPMFLFWVNFFQLNFFGDAKYKYCLGSSFLGGTRKSGIFYFSYVNLAKFQ